MRETEREREREGERERGGGEGVRRKEKASSRPAREIIIKAEERGPITRGD
jgi:hypothetical protein